MNDFDWFKSRWALILALVLLNLAFMAGGVYLVVRIARVAWGE